jgi:hypothetical protein
MKCPQCKSEMKLKSEQISYNSPEAKNKYYRKSTYHCEACDVWVTVEAPTEKDALA